MSAPIIYNLFPRLVGSMDRWPDHAARARQMGFNWIYLNPVQYPGFSGSLYAVKEFYRLNPLFVPPGTDDEMGLLARTLEKIRDSGVRVMMDLVINHTAKDSPLAKEHPDWFQHAADGSLVSPSAIDPADTRNVTVWGDLAEVDNETSADRQGLWHYWTRMALHYLDLGCDGFRCDAAYKVPAELWRHLIGAARKRRSDVLFAAETLGCRLSEVRELDGVGFDYLFNSAKYWNYDSSWALEQHEEFGAIAPSIAFAESHDTPRLWKESGGLAQVQKQRYAFTAFFSAGLLMPIGFEFGFTRRLDVVRTRPEDWQETGVDLSGFISRVNKLKLEIPVLGQEGRWKVATTLDAPTTVLRKESRDGSAPPVLVVINKDWHQHQSAPLPPLAAELGGGPTEVVRPFHDTAPRALPPAPAELPLGPAEVALIRAT